jgi:hypothetical protein
MLAKLVKPPKVLTYEQSRAFTSTKFNKNVKRIKQEKGSSQC